MDGPLDGGGGTGVRDGRGPGPAAEAPVHQRGLIPRLARYWGSPAIREDVAGLNERDAAAYLKPATTVARR
ncbi:hypothetical protein LX15_001938 [Streptoalloteichus tenebrarius]|uniref:Uncharacterized protein n=1 Tax=Streptoalloteichus tenebrarius (strain ATCC 17920 / DSM 40477 / JCM 4838 / CBS 697.72 / NBRC 16177 / NCIMB 11028 / NRRL B-12390 / A12253. 1 / ISP 5477) TaxID=1933 RepID=A0ABT1HRU9_STRSD|nr:hypothetical protein [Streptoalloteichus tenebrarius]